MRVLLTGCAGFIGFHTAKKLLERGDTVIGLDNLNPYYDPTLKEKRLSMLQEMDGFTFVHGDIKEHGDLEKAFKLLGSGDDTRICHLAAQAGVRHSIENPDIFIADNVHGTNNMLEFAKKYKTGGFIYASTSAVYGDNTEPVFAEHHKTDKPISLYGMSKKANELQAYCYHKLFGMKCTGLRFFTVYGTWGRPDMALFLFTNWAMKDEPMQIFGHGKMRRDFTYVDDIVSGIVAALDKNYDFEVFNLGGGKTEELMDYVAAVEKALGKEAKKEFLPMQQGDVVATTADISHAREKLGYEPKTHISEGVPKFVEWYKEYYGV
jgi:UDP-glucuronate 4-epimerase